MNTTTNTASFIGLIASHPYYLIGIVIAVPAIALLLAYTVRHLAVPAVLAVIAGAGYLALGGITGAAVAVALAVIARLLMTWKGEDTSTSIRPRPKIRYYVQVRNW